ncbi:MAG TPA: tetratricopeptide repeat protein [Myxococcales bacterium]|nr:tetratricopeptide repeat protein [Myxococcales bacterium]
MSVLKLLAALLLLAAPALADAASDAREHYKRGETHYALGEFEEAVKEFREAYRLVEKPAILFNIGQAYRQLRQWQQAHFYYRQYLSRDPEASNRADTESMIEQMRRRIDEEEEQRSRVARDPAAAHNDDNVLPAPPKPPAPAAAVSVRPPPAGMKPARVAAWIALGAGAVAEGAALLLHGSAQSSADQFNRKHAAGTLTAADQQLKSDAESKGRQATLAALGGAALLLTGATLWFAF